MKKLFVLLLVLCMASLAGATTVSWVDEGQTIIATPDSVVRLEVTSDAGLYALDAVATVVGGDVIVDAGCYCFDPYPPIIPFGLGTPTVEIGCGTLGVPPSGVVAYFDVLYTSGEQIVSIVNGMAFGGSGDTNFLTPDFSDGVVTIIPEPATLTLLGLGALALLRRRK